MKNHKYIALNGKALPTGELTADIMDTIKDQRNKELDCGRIKSYVMHDCFLCTPKTSRIHQQLNAPDDIWCTACGRNFYKGHDLTDYSKFAGTVQIDEDSITEEDEQNLKEAMENFVHTNTTDNGTVSFEHKPGSTVEEFSSLTFTGFVLVACLFAGLSVGLLAFLDYLGILPNLIQRILGN